MTHSSHMFLIPSKESHIWRCCSCLWGSSILFCSLHLIIFYVFSTNLHETQSLNYVLHSVFMFCISAWDSVCANILKCRILPYHSSFLLLFVLNSTLFLKKKKMIRLTFRPEVISSDCLQRLLLSNDDQFSSQVVDVNVSHLIYLIMLSISQNYFCHSVFRLK